MRCCIYLQITAVGTKSYLPDFEETKSVIFRISAATTGDRVQTALTGLTPGTLYSITVAAINGAGLGELSERVTATTRNGIITKIIILPVDLALVFPPS